MRRLARNRPSPSMIVALIALFVALSGASYAALSKNSVGTRQLKKNAVTTAKIKSNAVTGAKVADGTIEGADVKDATLGGADVTDASLTGADVTDASLTGADVKDATIGSPDITDGSVGLADLAPNSVNGSKVTDGSLGGQDVADGSLGATDVAAGTFLGGNVTVQYEIATAALADNTSKSLDVTCLPGETAIGGGSRGDVTDSEYTITTSSRPLVTGGGFPTDGQSFNGWRATVMNPSGNFPFAVPPPDGEIKPEVWAICAATG